MIEKTKINAEGIIFIDGSKFAESANFTINRITNAQEIKTIALGWAGLSPGAPAMTITVSNMIPAIGFEFDPGKKMLQLIPVEVTIYTSPGRTMTQSMFIINDTLSFGVDNPSIFLIGPTAEFEG